MCWVEWESKRAVVCARVSYHGFDHQMPCMRLCEAVVFQILMSTCREVNDIVLKLELRPLMAVLWRIVADINLLPIKNIRL
jgi:hypothetical protein